MFFACLAVVAAAAAAADASGGGFGRRLKGPSHFMQTTQQTQHKVRTVPNNNEAIVKKRTGTHM